MAVVGTSGSFRAAGYERAKGDLYETPDWCVDALVRSFQIRGPVREPHAGKGVIVGMLILHGFEVVASDLHDWSYRMTLPMGVDVPHIERGVDFLEETDLRGCASVVMNPPYGKDAEKHVRHALDLVPIHGSVFALLRWNWIAAKGRVDLLKKLHDVLILGRVNMPPFGAVDKGHTATTDYAWFRFENQPTNCTHIQRYMT